MKYLLPLGLLLILTGCSSSDDTNTTPSQKEQTTINMEINKSYEVSKGDKLTKTSTDAQVSIEKSLQGDTTTVTLLQGTAQITRAY